MLARPVFLLLLLWCFVATAGATFPLAQAAWEEALSEAVVLERSNPLEGRTTRETVLQDGSRPGVAAGVEGVTFTLTGPPGKVREFSWKAALEVPEGEGFLYLRYRAEGVLKTEPPYPVVSLLGGEEPPGVLVSQLSGDGLSHLLVVRCKLVGAQAVGVTLRTDASRASLRIEALGFAATLAEVPVPGGVAVAAFPEGWQAVDLAPFYNTKSGRFLEKLLSRKTDAAVADPVRWTPGEVIQLAGVPFQTGPSGRDLFLPTEDRSANNATATFLGQAVARWSFFPQSRDDVLAIPIGKPAAEIGLLLAARLPTTESRFMLPPGHFALEDVEEFVIEIEYEDGTLFQSFPYSLEDGGYRLRRAFGAYCIPADPQKVIREIRLRNRVFGKQIGLAALSLNQGAPLMPAAVRDPGAAAPLPPPLPLPGGAPRVRAEGRKLTLANRYYTVVVDLADGFRIESFEHRPLGHTAKLGADSGLRIVHEGRTLTGRDFKVTQTQTNLGRASLLLVSKVPECPLEVRLEFGITDTPALALGLSIRNKGDASFRGSVAFPYLEGVTLGSDEETWLFFPQYRNVLTNEACTLQASNDRAFPLQFFDIFNAGAGAGISFMTQNREGAPIDYRLAKQGGAVAASILYPAGYEWLKPGETRAFAPVQIGFHLGDWKQAMADYQRWIASTHPADAGRGREWLRKVFLIRSYDPSAPEAATILHTAPIFDKATNSFHRLDEALAMDRIYSGGYYPDAFHFYNWFYSDEAKQDMWGDYDETGYARLGGLPRFAEAIRRIQEDYKIPVSLYFLSDRVSKETRVGRKLGEALASVWPDGSLQQDEHAYYIWPGSKRWVQWYSETIRRVQRETGARMIYLDVFGTLRSQQSYSPDHGPHLPQWGNEASGTMLRAVRASVPPEVVLFSEYPIDDVNNADIDGFLNYTWQPLYEHIQKVYDTIEQAPQHAPVATDVYRYLFPRIVQWGFAVGMEGNGERSWYKGIFFNGLSLYDTAWRLYPSRTLEMLQTSHRLRHQFPDCFTTQAPEPMVPTGLKWVYANRFPGEGRTLWTLYNARFQTAHGPVLRIPHREGATYRDVWNGTPLHPVIEGGVATLHLTLPPQGLGCVVQEF